MKKVLFLVLLIFSIALVQTTLSSCNRKSGCPMNEQAVTKPKKNGTYTKGKSNLFDKQTRKKMAKKS